MTDAVRHVAVTGASGYIGARLVRRLEQEEQIEGILAIDVLSPAQPFGPKVVFVQHDISVPIGAALVEHGTEAVAHLAFVLNPGRDRVSARRVNVGGTAHLLEACAGSDVRKLLSLSSTSVYGAHPDNPPMLTEESPPRPVRGVQYSEDKLEAEGLVRRFSEGSPSLTTTILRGGPVMGPGADNFIARAFLKPFLVAVRGFDPPMQLLHEDDLTEVLALCILQDAPGLYNVAGEGTVRWSEMARMLGRRLVRAPSPLLRAATDLSWLLRLQSESPSNGLSFITHRWTASTEKVQRELGVKFRYSSKQAWEAFAKQHRLHHPADPATAPSSPLTGEQTIHPSSPLTGEDTGEGDSPQ